MIKPQSIGGAIMAIRQRQKAISSYMLNPNLCKTCSNPILINDKDRVSEVRRKVFCTRACAASFNNKKRQRKAKPPKLRKVSLVSSTEKRAFFSRCKNWQSARSCIQRLARQTYLTSQLPKVCKVCGYSTHVDIAHIKSVSSFSDTALISDINSLSNLVALCKNHHWEYDHGYLSL